MTPLYTATATATGGREGRSRTDDGKVDVPLSLPKELGGPGGAGTNPEQLFAAGYAACYESALRLVARMQKKALGDGTSITARVTLGKTAEGAFELAVELRGRLVGLSPDEGRALMEAAHQVCPYSRATRNNVEVELTLES